MRSYYSKLFAACKAKAGGKRTFFRIAAMQWACGAGVMQGANGKLLPTAEATRAQTAAMLHRFCEDVLK